jgi:predicted nucleic acid-binding protein
VRLYFDTNVFIHAFEARAEIGDRARAAFSLVDDGRAVGVTSQLTLAELLPGPYRKQDVFLEQTYESIFAGRDGFEIYPVSLDLLRASAKLRADAGLRLPDALHVATAMKAACDGFVTEDKSLRTPIPVRILLLTDQLFARVQ